MMDGVFDRSPPASLEAETAVLGGCLIDKAAIGRAVEIVNDRMFYREANRRIFRAVVRLWERGETTDVVTLSEELKAMGEFDAAGGFDYLAGLVDAVPTAANIEYHARIMRDRWLLREMIEASSQNIRDAYDPGSKKAEDIIADAERRILQVGSSHQLSKMLPVKATLWDTFEELERFAEKKGPGIGTGFRGLDHKLAGLEPGKFYVVAGRPSMGKTALALNILQHVTIGERRPAGIFSLEMTAEELTMRILAAEGRIDLLQMRRGNFSQEAHQRLAKAAGAINTAPLYIDDGTDARIHDIRAKARRVVRAEKLEVLVVDYLQLMEGDGGDRREAVDAISRGLKLMARELNVAVIGVSQLSRSVESRSNKRPMLSDLRESGAIEQDADVVLFVYRPEYYLEPEKAKKSGLEGVAEVIVAKQRNGPTGSLTMQFDKPTARFFDKEVQGDAFGSS